MMPPTYQLLMPAVLAGGAGLIASRNPRRYPALLAWACLTAVFVGAVWGGGPYPSWIMAAAALVLPFQIRECLVCFRFAVSWRKFAAVWAAVVAASVVAALLTSPAHFWTVARSYYQLGGMVVMLCAAIFRQRRQVLQYRRDLAYFAGMTIWLCIKAPASSFVRGGLGQVLWPSVSRDSVEQACYWLLMVCMTGMALAMWAKAPGRKRAAKTPKGQTRTGLIEMAKAG